MENSSPIKRRILQYVESLGISKRDFYAKTGISRGTLESKTSITEDTVAKFLAHYGNVSPEWLLSGKGEMVAAGTAGEPEAAPPLADSSAAEVAARISLLIDHLGLNVNAFAKQLGYERSQAIYDIVKGKAKPSFDFFSRFLSTEHANTVAVEWLITGRGEMAKGASGTAGEGVTPSRAGKAYAPIKDRIILFVESQGIAKEEFFRKIEMSSSNFKGKGAQSEIGGDKIAKILHAYPAVNPEWLLTGSGAMCKDLGAASSTPPGSSTIMDRIYLFVGSLGITVSEFSRKVGVSNGYFAKQKANEASIGSHILEKVACAFPQVNLTWLVTGQGEMLHTPASLGSNRADGKTVNRFPLYPVEAVLGATPPPAPVGFIEIPHLTQRDGAVYATGASIQDGNIFVTVNTVRHAGNGQ